MGGNSAAPTRRLAGAPSAPPGGALSATTTACTAGAGRRGPEAGAALALFKGVLGLVEPALAAEDDDGEEGSETERLAALPLRRIAPCWRMPVPARSFRTARACCCCWRNGLTGEPHGDALAETEVALEPATAGHGGGVDLELAAREGERNGEEAGVGEVGVVGEGASNPPWSWLAGGA